MLRKLFTEKRTRTLPPFFRGQQSMFVCENQGTKLSFPMCPTRACLNRAHPPATQMHTKPEFDIESSSHIKPPQQQNKRMSTVEERIATLGLVIPPAPTPLANYVPYVISGNLVHISGQVSGTKPENFIKGHVTEKGDVEGTIDLELAREASKVCILNLISQLKAAVGGDLEKVSRIVKINVFVNAHPSFTQAPQVANAASDILVAVFGETVGKHARCALGVSQLPFGCSVEIDGLVEIKQ